MQQIPFIPSLNTCKPDQQSVTAHISDTQTLTLGPAKYRPRLGISRHVKMLRENKENAQFFWGLGLHCPYCCPMPILASGGGRWELRFGLIASLVAAQQHNCCHNSSNHRKIYKNLQKFTLHCIFATSSHCPPCYCL